MLSAKKETWLLGSVTETLKDKRARDLNEQGHKESGQTEGNCRCFPGQVVRDTGQRGLCTQ